MSLENEALASQAAQGHAAGRGMHAHHPSAGAAHEAEVKKKADAFLKAVYEKGDVSREGKAITKDKDGYALDAETLAYLIKHKEIIELKKDDMMPSYERANYGNQAQPDGHYERPIYVIPGLEPGTQAAQELKIKTPQGDKDIQLVSEAYHKFDADYYRNVIQYTNGEIANARNIEAMDKYVPEMPEMRERYKELLAYTKQSASAAHVTELKIAIGTDGSDNVSSLQTAEKTNYILLTREKLNEALKTPEGFEAFKKSIDQETAFVGKGGNDPETAVANKSNSQEADAFFQNFPEMRNDRQDTLILPRENIPVSDQTLKYMAEHGDLQECKKEDLVPWIASSPFFNKKDAEGRDIPIYVVPGASGEPDFEGPRGRLMTTKEGKPYILINEGYHNWTPEYAIQQLAKQEIIDTAIKDKKLTESGDYLAQLHKKMGDTPEYEAMAVRYQKLMASIARQEGLTDEDHPKILIDQTRTADFSDGPGAAMSTQEGNRYVILNERFLKKALSSDANLEAFQGAVGHELTHIANKDDMAAAVARDHNNTLQYKQAEYLADLGGAGPLGTQNPDGATKLFEEELHNRISAYLKDSKNPRISENHPTTRDLKAVSNWDAAGHNGNHPPLMERIAALQEEGRLMKKYEVEFEAANHHKPASKEELVAESKAVIAQVILEIKDKKLPPAELTSPDDYHRQHHPEPAVKPSSGLSSQEKIDAVKASLGNKYHQPAEQAHADTASVLAIVPVSEATRAVQKANTRSA